ncbi:MAG TPA: hypothetical protein VHS03_10735 [Gaiellaceae bacterium]|nr:hypothetical protein [Gaiellaceae bacterium]
MSTLAALDWKVVLGFGMALVFLTTLAFGVRPRASTRGTADSDDFSGLPPERDVSARATRAAVVASGVIVSFVLAFAVLGAFGAGVVTGQREFGWIALMLAAVGPLLIIVSFVFVRR